MDGIHDDLTISSGSLQFSTPVSQRALCDYSHIYDEPPAITKGEDIVTASRPNFSNIVLVTRHNSDLNLDVLFNILPIVTISPKQIEQSGKKYGHMFISVRKYPKRRGYRGNSKIKSFLDLDYYYNDNSFHLKISKNNITIVGGKSAKFSEEMIRSIYDHFIDMNNEWIRYVGMSDQDKDEIMEMFEKDIQPPREHPQYEFYNLLENIIDRYEDDINDRLRDIFPLIGVPLYGKTPVFTELVNCNLVYNYLLPKPILLKKKAEDLEELGYEVTYDNMIFIKQFIAKWYDKEHGDSFTFTIQTIGAIKQNTSSTHDRSIQMYEKIVKDLGFVPYTPGLPFATKKVEKKNVQIQVTPEADEFLDKYLKI